MWYGEDKNINSTTAAGKNCVRFMLSIAAGGNCVCFMLSMFLCTLCLVLLQESFPSYIHAGWRAHEPSYIDVGWRSHEPPYIHAGWRDHDVARCKKIPIHECTGTHVLLGAGPPKWNRKACQLAIASSGNSKWCMAVYEQKEDPVISGSIIRQRFYGHHILFEKIFKALPDHIFVDVGANVGYHTFQAASTISCPTISFEPNPETATLIRHSMDRNCLNSNIFLVESATGASSGKASMSLYKQSPGMATLASTKDITSGVDSSNFQTNVFMVNVTTVDTELLNWQTTLTPKLNSACSGKISLMKIDAEGFEEHVLEGARDLLRLKENSAGTLLFDPPLFIHIEIFPTMMYAAKSSPVRTLMMLGKKYTLFLGLGVGVGGREFVSRCTKAGFKLHHAGVCVIPVENNLLNNFFSPMHGGHVDVFGQLTDHGNRVPWDLDLMNKNSLLLSASAR